MLTSIVSEIKMNKVMEEKTIARYLAQAGIDHGLYIIENASTPLTYPYNKEIELGNNNRVYRIAITKIGDIISINSTGINKIDGAIIQQVAIVATVQEDGQVIIQE